MKSEERDDLSDFYMFIVIKGDNLIGRQIIL